MQRGSCSLESKAAWGQHQNSIPKLNSCPDCSKAHFSKECESTCRMPMESKQLVAWQGYWHCLGEFGAGFAPWAVRGRGLARHGMAAESGLWIPGLRLLLAGHTPHALQPHRHAFSQLRLSFAS